MKNKTMKQERVGDKMNSLVICKLCGEEIGYYSYQGAQFYGCAGCAIGVHFGGDQTFTCGAAAVKAFNAFFADNAPNELPETQEKNNG